MLIQLNIWSSWVKMSPERRHQGRGCVGVCDSRAGPTNRIRCARFIPRYTMTG